jgi:hypothetical protein
MGLSAQKSFISSSSFLVVDLPIYSGENSEKVTAHRSVLSDD